MPAPDLLVNVLPDLIRCREVVDVVEAPGSTIVFQHSREGWRLDPELAHFRRLYSTEKRRTEWLARRSSVRYFEVDYLGFDSAIQRCRDQDPVVPRSRLSTNFPGPGDASICSSHYLT